MKLVDVYTWYVLPHDDLVREIYEVSQPDFNRKFPQAERFIWDATYPRFSRPSTLVNDILGVLDLKAIGSDTRTAVSRVGLSSTRVFLEIKLDSNRTMVSSLVDLSSSLHILCLLEISSAGRLNIDLPYYNGIMP